MFYIILFIQGIMSFFHPCIFSMIPIYLGYITSGLDTQSKNYKRNVILNSILFMFGVWTTFLILSVVFSIVGGALSIYKDYLIIFGGLFISLFGLHHLGVVHIRFFDHQPNVGGATKNIDNKYLSSFLLGLTISFGWTPCVGPVLSSILVLITTHGEILIALFQMIIYVLGWTIPFLTTALFSIKFIEWFNSNENFIKYVQVISGTLILLTGVHLIYTQGKTIYTKNNLSDVYNISVKSNNEELKLSEYLDKTTVIFFLDSTCGACIDEVKEINKLNKKGVSANLLGVVKAKKYPKEFIKSLDIDFIYDEEEYLFAHFNIDTKPSYIILNKDGEAKVNAIGMFDEKTLLKEIKELK